MGTSINAGIFRSGAKFGLLYAALLGISMGFVIFVGSIIGDCDPGPGCHDNDAVIIGWGILSALPVIALASLAVCASAGIVRHALEDRMGIRPARWLLAGLTLAAVWGSFDLAMLLHMRLTT